MDEYRLMESKSDECHLPEICATSKSSCKLKFGCRYALFFELQANFWSLAYCVDGDYNRASEQLAKVREAIPPELISPKTLLLAVYILLKKGDRQKALSILRTGNILLFNWKLPVTVNCRRIINFEFLINLIV